MIRPSVSLLAVAVASVSPVAVRAQQAQTAPASADDTTDAAGEPAAIVVTGSDH